MSRFGAIAFASSLDQVGPRTKVEDAARLLDVLSGHDPRDSTSIPSPASDTLRLSAPIEGLRIGVPSEYFAEGLESKAERRCVRRWCLWRDRVSLSRSRPYPLCASSLLPVATAEASSNLARYDGVAYGHRSANAGPLDAMISASRAEGFGPEATRRLLLGTYALSSGYYDAYYLKAQKVRTLVRRDLRRPSRPVT